MPEVVAVLTGRFERNPPLFYEMRLARVAAHLRDRPDDLAAYDDAGVACDRLGRGDEAISWMEEKRARLERLDPSLPEAKEHRYRYHANLGTFLAHRWARQGADRARIAEVEAARDEIAKALKINPDAHFGRERYQLLALEWIADPPELPKQEQYLPNFLGWDAGDAYGEMTKPEDADKAVRGLAGLIVLGNAWESLDVFNALDVALQRDSVGYKRGRDGGRNTLAYFAWLRCCELVDAGKGSMLPGAPKGEALRSKLPRPDFVKPDVLLDPTFQELRAGADSWHAARTAFMMTRLEGGRHPDTDPHFWDGYSEAPAPGLPEQSVPDAYNAWHESYGRKVRLATGAIAALAVASLATYACIRIVKARRRDALPAKSSSTGAGAGES